MAHVVLTPTGVQKLDFVRILSTALIRPKSQASVQYFVQLL